MRPVPAYGLVGLLGSHGWLPGPIGPVVLKAHLLLQLPFARPNIQVMACDSDGGGHTTGQEDFGGGDSLACGGFSLSLLAGASRLLSLVLLWTMEQLWAPSVPVIRGRRQPRPSPPSSPFQHHHTRHLVQSRDVLVKMLMRTEPVMPATAISVLSDPS